MPISVYKKGNTRFIRKNILIILFICIIFSQFNISEIKFASSASEPYILNETGKIEIGEPFAICHGHGGTIEEAQNLSNIGVQMSRNDITWAAIEQELGVYNFGGYDNFYSNIHSVGVEPLAILDYGNNHLFPDTDGRIIQEEHMSAWLNFVNATVRHFMINITYWEIWNEPNLGGFWSGTDDEFFNVLNQTMRLIREINPELRILAPGISGHSPDYLNSMIDYIGDEDFNTYIDILPFHPYSGSSAEEVRYKSLLVWDVVHKHNFSGEVWITEVGRSTQISSPDKQYEQPYEHYIQARELIKAYSTALGENVSKIVWYCYSDSWNINWTYGEAAFGIIYRKNETATSWSIKPSGYLYKKLSDRLTNSTFYPDAIIPTGFKFGSDANDYYYYFKTSYNSSIIVLWTQSTPFNVELRSEGILSVKSHSLFDVSEEYIQINNLKFDIGEVPIFLEIFWEDDIANNIFIKQNPKFIQLFAFIIGPIIFFVGVIIVVRNLRILSKRN